MDLTIGGKPLERHFVQPVRGRTTSCFATIRAASTLARKAGKEEPEGNLTKAEASMKIDELREGAGSGVG
jgi:hypothetical protein